MRLPRLPLLPLRPLLPLKPLKPLPLPAPTGAAFPPTRLDIRLKFSAPTQRVELTSDVQMGAIETAGMAESIEWLTQWVRQAFTETGNSWQMDHASFSKAVKALTCAKLNTAGTYNNSTPYTLVEFRQELEDTNGSQTVLFVFALSA